MTAPARVLLVEDEPDIAEIVQYNLVKEGFLVEVQGRGDSALEAIRRRPPDVILLDLMLPGIDGLELTRTLKRDPVTATVPLVMLTAKGEEVDRIVGLELGADDYLTKPFSPRELVLRVRAVLRRRSGETPPTDVLEAGALRLDAGAHRLEIRGKDVPLTATEFRLLQILLERRGRVQSRAKLLSDVWGYSEEVDSRTVDTHVRRLRGKLGSGGASHRNGDRRRVPPQDLTIGSRLGIAVRAAPHPPALDLDDGLPPLGSVTLPLARRISACDPAFLALRDGSPMIQAAQPPQDLPLGVQLTSRAEGCRPRHWRRRVRVDHGLVGLR